MNAELLAGDCIDRMRELADGSIDAIVTDPPYGLEFMGKDWDRPWAVSAEQSVGYAGRDDLSLPSHRDGRNANCRKCGGRARGAKRCQCDEPDWDRHPREDMLAFQQWTEEWASEALRVLKPGGYLLAFGGTRTAHRLSCGLEDAGFEIRDTLAWMYGSGFPKSLNVARAISDAGRGEPQGGKKPSSPNAGKFKTSASEGKRSPSDKGQHFGAGPGQFMAEQSEPYEFDCLPEAEPWIGWGTALKPAYEPIIVARKPLAGTVAANVLAHGTGAINVDACRIGFASADDEASAFPGGATTSHGAGSLAGPGDAQETHRDVFQAVRSSEGRWPANVVLSHTDGCVLVGEREVKGDGNWSGSTESVGYEGGWDTTDHPRDRRVPAVETVEVWECAPDCPVRLLDVQTGELRSGEPGTMRLGENTGAAYGAESRAPGTPMTGYGDVGGASRFFYCAKTSRAERNAGLDASFQERMLRWSSGDESPGTFQSDGTEKSARNHHPTVKPINVMRWLLRLVTPPDGVVLDPFLGSGSTGCAAALEPVVGRFVGIERESDYLDIARARIAFWQEHGQDALEVVRIRSQSEERRREIADAGQLDLLSEA